MIQISPMSQAVAPRLRPSGQGGQTYTVAKGDSSLQDRQAVLRRRQAVEEDFRSQQGRHQESGPDLSGPGHQDPRCLNQQDAIMIARTINRGALLLVPRRPDAVAAARNRRHRPPRRPPHRPRRPRPRRRRYPIDLGKSIGADKTVTAPIEHLHAARYHLRGGQHDRRREPTRRSQRSGRTWNQGEAPINESSQSISPTGPARPNFTSQGNTVASGEVQGGEFSLNGAAGGQPRNSR